METVVSQEEDGVFKVDVKTEEHTGLLIGGKGETLAAIQSFLGIAMKQKTGEWIKIYVNVGDWREKQEDYLKNLANQAAARAQETGQPQNLYNLNAGQRRVVHLALSQDTDLVTESLGEGQERYLVVKPKL